jgi:hypothetical protein
LLKLAGVAEFASGAKANFCAPTMWKPFVRPTIDQGLDIVAWLRLYGGHVHTFSSCPCHTFSVCVPLPPCPLPERSPSFGEYLNLLDWTCRQLRADKRGPIPQDLAPILERLHIGGGDGWLQLIGRFRRLFRRAAGRTQSLAREREQHGCRVMQGLRYSRTVFL